MEVQSLLFAVSTQLVISPEPVRADEGKDSLPSPDDGNFGPPSAQCRLLMEREEERKLLARELHDCVIQDLIGIKYQLETISSEVNQHGGDLVTVRNSLCALIDVVRHICTDLRPPTMDSLGLGAALQSYAYDWSARTGVAVLLDVEAGWGRLPEPVELSIFRIVQEGLSNVWKHAQATRAYISLHHTSSGLMISVADNGRGMPGDLDPATLAAAGHFGLLGISERAGLLSGCVRMQNSPGGGVMLQVEIPAGKVL